MGPAEPGNYRQTLMPSGNLRAWTAWGRIRRIVANGPGEIGESFPEPMASKCERIIIKEQ